MNFVKFLRTPFLQNTSGGCFITQKDSTSHFSGWSIRTSTLVPTFYKLCKPFYKVDSNDDCFYVNAIKLSKIMHKKTIMNKFVGNNIIVLLSETFNKTLASARKSVFTIVFFFFHWKQKRRAKKNTKITTAFTDYRNNKKRKITYFPNVFFFFFWIQLSFCWVKKLVSLSNK